METHEGLFTHYAYLSKRYEIYRRIYTALQGVPKKYALLTTLEEWREHTTDQFENAALRVAIRNVRETHWTRGRKPGRKVLS